MLSKLSPIQFCSPSVLPCAALRSEAFIRPFSISRTASAFFSPQAISCLNIPMPGVAANGHSRFMSTGSSRFSQVESFLASSQLPSVGDFETSIFNKEKIIMADRTEHIIRGGRDIFSKLPAAFKDIKQIGVIGWSSQGPAQAMNLRDSLEGTGIKVKVGLRENSNSMKLASEAGFTVENGTLGEMYKVIRDSDLSIILISDAAMAQEHQNIFNAVKPGSYLGISHGFVLGYLKSLGKDFPDNINVIAVCPKGMGPSVRRLYEQGKSVNGAGINCSFAVYRDVSKRATEVAIGWAVALGSPSSFFTTLESEYKSDIFGERGILLGAVHGICEVLYRYFRAIGVSEEQSYMRSAECITGPISKIISTKGIYAVYELLKDKAAFERAYSLTYYRAMEILVECYREVYTGREIQSVIDHYNRFKLFPVSNIDTTELWRVATAVKSKIRFSNPSGAVDLNKLTGEDIDPVTAGMYIATMIAQCDLLMASGHAYSEVANESIIEAVDSLNPYMHFKGVSYMVDNCSTTARLGSRKWAPRFDYLFSQTVTNRLVGSPSEASRADIDNDLIKRFKEHKMHGIFKVCCDLRPSVDILPTETFLGEGRSTSGTSQAL